MPRIMDRVMADFSHDYTGLFLRGQFGSCRDDVVAAGIQQSHHHKAIDAVSPPPSGPALCVYQTAVWA